MCIQLLPVSWHFQARLSSWDVGIFFFYPKKKNYYNNNSFTSISINKLQLSFKHRSITVIKGKLSWAVNLKKTAWTFQVWFKAASIEGKTVRIWRAFSSERDNSRQKSWFHERKVAEKPAMLPCCHKQIYLNACAAHDSFPLNQHCCGSRAL